MQERQPVRSAQPRCCQQQPTANITETSPPSTNRRKKGKHCVLTAHHIATVSASQKACCPCLEIAFASPPDPRLCYCTQVLSTGLSQPAARSVFCHQTTHSQQRPLALPHRANFLAGWCHRAASLTRLRDSISCAFDTHLLRQGPALRFWYFHTATIRAPASRFRTLACLPSPRLRRNTSQT